MGPFNVQRSKVQRQISSPKIEEPFKGSTSSNPGTRRSNRSKRSMVRPFEQPHGRLPRRPSVPSPSRNHHDRLGLPLVLSSPKDALGSRRYPIKPCSKVQGFKGLSFQRTDSGRRLCRLRRQRKMRWRMIINATTVSRRRLCRSSRRRPVCRACARSCARPWRRAAERGRRQALTAMARFFCFVFSWSLLNYLRYSTGIIIHRPFVG